MLKEVSLLLATLCLAQHACVAHAASDEELGDTLRNRMLSSVLDEYSKIAEYAVKECKSIYQKAIHEGSPQPNAELQAQLSKLSEYVEKVNKFEETRQNKDQDDVSEQLIILLMDALNLYIHFNTGMIENPTADIVEVERLLKKHGIETFFAEFVRRMLNVMNSVSTKLETYISSLNTLEREKDKKLVDWYNRLKNEKAVEKKYAIMAEFSHALKHEDSEEYIK